MEDHTGITSMTMSICIWSISDRNVEAQPTHQIIKVNMNSVVRFSKFSIARLHLYQEINAKITPKCSLAKIDKGW